VQVVTTMDLIELDASSLQPLRRFGYMDISPAFKVCRQTANIAVHSSPRLQGCDGS